MPPRPRDAERQFELSTDDLPERDRVDYWREVIGRTILRMEVSPLPDRPLQVSLAGRLMPGLVILRGVNGGLRLERTPELITDGNDDLHLPLTVSGVSVVNLRGRDVAVGEPARSQELDVTVGQHREVRLHRVVQPDRVAKGILLINAPCLGQERTDLCPEMKSPYNSTLRGP